MALRSSGLRSRVMLAYITRRKWRPARGTEGGATPETTWAEWINRYRRPPGYGTAVGTRLISLRRRLAHGLLPSANFSSKSAPSGAFFVSTHISTNNAFGAWDEVILTRWLVPRMSERMSDSMATPRAASRSTVSRDTGASFLPRTCRRGKFGRRCSTGSTWDSGMRKAASWSSCTGA